LLLPGPHTSHKFFARQIRAALALNVQLPLHDHLRGDARVIRAGLPEGVLTQHAVVTRERVHERVLECMAHVQRARHVRRRDHDAERLAFAPWRKPALRFPPLVDSPLDFVRRVNLFHWRSDPRKTL
jgi:hypothetical protein